MAERMRVPRPPAMTTAASLGRDSDTVGTLAGAPGFEPGITGPKPVALPLGHAPVNRDAECTRRPGRAGRSAAVEQEHGQCNRRENGDDDDRQDADEHEADGNEHDDELRDGGEPRPRANARRAVIPADPDVQRHGAGGRRDDEPPGQDAGDDQDAPRLPRCRRRSAPGGGAAGARTGSRDARRRGRSCPYGRHSRACRVGLPHRRDDPGLAPPNATPRLLLRPARRSTKRP